MLVKSLFAAVVILVFSSGSLASHGIITARFGQLQNNFVSLLTSTADNFLHRAAVAGTFGAHSLIARRATRGARRDNDEHHRRVSPARTCFARVDHSSARSDSVSKFNRQRYCRSVSQAPSLPRVSSNPRRIFSPSK